MRVATILSLFLLAFTAGCPNEDGVTCEPADCDDGDPCTEDVCGPTGCLHDPTCECDVDTDCEDGDACTLNTCRQEGTCATTLLTTPECTACDVPLDCATGGVCDLVDCIAGHCHVERMPGCCTVDEDCTGTDPCVDEVCMEGSCVGQPIAGCLPCTSAASCDDANACTTDTCDALVCAHAAIGGCGVVTNRTFTVGDAPEGMVVLDLRVPPWGPDFLGLATDGVHLLVASSAAAVDDVNLTTGATSQLDAPWGAFGLECYRAQAGDFCAAPGTFGWYTLSSGLTATDASGVATDAAASPPDAQGRSAEVFYVQANRLRARRTDFTPGREVPPAAFPGGAYPSRPTSAVYLGADDVLVLFESGELYSAPLEPVGTTTAATLVTDLGGAAASMRYLNCTDPDATGARVCVATNFGESRGHLIDIDGAGAFHFGPDITTGAGPVEIAITWSSTPGTALIGSTGFDDDVIRIHAYDGTAVTLEDEGTFAECDAPGHALWVDSSTLAVSCNASDTVKILGRGFDD